MTKEEFNILLSKCSKKAIDFASKYVSNDMPFKFKYDVRLNVSNDNPNLSQFDIYPEDNNKTVRLQTKVDFFLVGVSC